MKNQKTNLISKEGYFDGYHGKPPRTFIYYVNQKAYNKGFIKGVNAKAHKLLTLVDATMSNMKGGN